MKVCEVKQNMLNKIKEEVHAKTLTNLGTEIKSIVCVYSSIFFLINY